jgi:NTE family protein
MVDEVNPSSAAKVVQDAAAFQWDGGKLERGIGIALSGGGFRAMLFHAGALARMNELGLLSRTQRISSVSAGSIMSGHLALSWSKLGQADRNGTFANFQHVIVDPIYNFSRQSIDIGDVLTGLLPWTSGAEKLAKSYEKSLFGTKTLQDMPDSPHFIFCATNLQTGVLWRFSKPYAGDYVVGRLDKPAIAISHAVAASSAYPPILSPLKLEFPKGSFTDWPSGPSLDAGEIDAFRSRVLLYDGGYYDNHGIEPIVKRYLTDFVSDGGKPFERMADVHLDWISQYNRTLYIYDNQVRALRRRDLIQRFIDGNNVRDETKLTGDARMGAYWGVDTDPRRVDPPNAVPCDGNLTHKLARVSTGLSDLGETVSKQVINWGYAICDRSLRTNYNGAMAAAQPKLPYPEAPLTAS